MIEELTGCLTVSNKGIPRVEKPRKKINAVGIVKYYQSAKQVCFRLKLGGRRLSPLIAKNETWQRWDSNPRLRRDWCPKPAPSTTRPRYKLRLMLFQSIANQGARIIYQF